MEARLVPMIIEVDEVRDTDFVVIAPIEAAADCKSGLRLVFREEAPQPLLRQTRGRMTAPTIEEIKAEIVRLGYHFDAEEFHAHYDANGWVQKGGTPIRNWKACLVTWEKARITRVVGQRPPTSPPVGMLVQRHWFDEGAPGWIREIGERMSAPPKPREFYEPGGALHVSAKRQLAFGRWIAGEDVKDPG